MKKIILTIVISLLNSLGIAQTEIVKDFNGEIKWGQVITRARNSSSTKIIGQDGAYIYLIRSVDGQGYLAKYNLNDLRLEKSVPLDIRNGQRGVKLVDQFMLGGKPVLYTSQFNKKKKTTSTFIRTINPSELVVIDQVFLSASVAPKIKGVFGTVFTNGAGSLGRYAGDFITSENGELGFTSEAIFPNDVKVTEDAPIKKKKAHLYDKELNVLAETDFELPYDNFEVQHTQLSNDGLVYMAGFRVDIVEDDSKLFVQGKRKYGDLLILVLNPESGQTNLVKVDLLEGKKVIDYKYNIEDDGSIIVSGFIMNEEERVACGAFYTKYDANLRKIAQNSFDFESSFIMQSWSEKRKKEFEKVRENSESSEKVEETFSNYIVRDLIVKGDKSVVVLAEEVYTEIYTGSYDDFQGNRYKTTDYHYHYNDIIAMSFSPDGELEWKSLIKKRQYSVNDGGYYSSFKTFINGDYLNIIYNLCESDLVNADGMTNKERKAKNENNIGIILTLDKNGKQFKQKFYDFGDDGGKIVPSRCEKLAEDLVFIFARSEGKDHFGTLTF